MIITYVLVILRGLWLGKDLKSSKDKSERPKVRYSLSMGRAV